MKRVVSILLALALALLACNFPFLGSPPTPEATAAVDAVGTTVAQTVTALAPSSPGAPATRAPAATATPTPLFPAVPEESVLILEPGPGSRVVSPVRVAGLSDPVFEQQLLVEIVRPDGTVVAQETAFLNAEPGQRGPFEVEVPFEVGADEQAFIQVSRGSLRDGGIIHLSSVGVTLLRAGPAEIRPPGADRSERIVLFAPAPDEIVSGGVAHVEGFALASFEQTLVVQVLSADGTVIGQQPVIVQAPDVGQPGPFTADVPYTVTGEQPGRILVLDPSAAGAGNVHVASVEVILRP